MLENVNNLLENETERLLSWRGEGRELVCQSLPRGYAEKCFDFDSIKVDQLTHPNLQRHATTVSS